MTSPDERAEVGGQHVHSFPNPSGLVFTLACYRAAPECVGEGPATTFWTWLPGYAWQVALCGACTSQLGWRFQSHSDVFHGLIVGRVVTVDRPD